MGSSIKSHLPNKGAGIEGAGIEGAEGIYI
jgi:hypothetical protein